MRAATRTLFTTVALAASAAGALAAEPGPASAAALYREALAATCANCHGTRGEPIAKPAVPGLAGLPANYFKEQMQGFKNGSRPATVMHQIAKGFSDAQIDALAEYFAARPH